MIFQLSKGSNESRAKVISQILCENFYVQDEDPSKAKNLRSLIHTHGYSKVANASQGYCRCMYRTATDRCFIIIYNGLYEMSTSEELTLCGLLETSVGICNICDNGNELFIVDGTYGYTCSLSTLTVTKITDANFPSNPSHCIFTDGYFICNEGSSGRFWYSASYDGTDWDGLDFATAEYSQDNLVGITKTSNGTLWMIGNQSIELWQNVGATDLPWRRIQGSVKEIGCIGKYSIASNGSQVFFLGSGSHGHGSVFIGNGYDVQKISTPALEYQLKLLSSSLVNAYGFCFSDEGHSFYVLSIGSQKTFVYDLVTGEWHNRASLNTSTGINMRQFSQGYCFFNNKHYVGHFNNPNVYEMSLDYYDEDGEEVRRVVTTSCINNENKILRHKSFELDFERGLGMISDSRAPQVVLQWSNDGGHTWSNESWASVSKSVGSIGEYNVRAIWRRLGKARNRVYKIVCSDSVGYVINNAFVEVM